MPQFLEVYKCAKCSNIVAMLQGGGPVMHCCGETMQLLREGVSDGAREKHLPVIEKTAKGYTVKVGSVPHPMEEKHWIQWVELLADGASYFRFLHPGQAPEAEFCIEASRVTARAYCNLHGLWKAEL